MLKVESNIKQPDPKIIQRSVEGDAKAFEVIVKQLQEYAFALAFRILLSTEDAQDAVQDSFIKVWNKLDSYKHKHLFTTWLYRIIVNTCLDKLKLNKQQIEYGFSDVEVSEDMEQSLINRDLARQIKLLSNSLPQKQRLAFVLIDLQCLSLSEAVYVLKLTKGQVKSNLYYARKTIRETLLKKEEGRSAYVV